MKRIIPEPFLTYSQNQRKNKNPWEAKLWQHLRAGRFYGLKFKRQVQIGKYLYDFSCREKMMLIELDGGQHSESPGVVRDEQKTKYAEKEGYRVLRFQNIDLNNNLEGVLDSIKQACKL
jgi:very-short-patch-repair endonuclease